MRGGVTKFLLTIAFVACSFVGAAAIAFVPALIIEHTVFIAPDDGQWQSDSLKLRAEIIWRLFGWSLTLLTACGLMFARVAPEKLSLEAYVGLGATIALCLSSFAVGSIHLEIIQYMIEEHAIRAEANSYLGWLSFAQRGLLYAAMPIFIGTFFVAKPMVNLNDAL